ncbi:hypothetical protein KHQ81_03770 [Mycoplasmatota bacterium]|nr:hypothetical protein KHQ81_03770 [Mycoplasmatota bacterium]
MKLEVIIGKKESGRGRVFNNINQASFYMTYQEKQALINLQEKLGSKIETRPKYKNEIKRIVYRNDSGDKHYYILKVTN